MKYLTVKLKWMNPILEERAKVNEEEVPEEKYLCLAF